MLLQSLVKRNNSTLAWNFAPKFSWKPKKEKKRFSPHSGSISERNFRFLVAMWVLLAKKPRGRDIFQPLQCQTRQGAASCLPKIDASEYIMTRSLTQGCHSKNTHFIYNFMTKRAKKLWFFLKIYTGFLWTFMIVFTKFNDTYCLSKAKHRNVQNWQLHNSNTINQRVLFTISLDTRLILRL